MASPRGSAVPSARRPPYAGGQLLGRDDDLRAGPERETNAGDARGDDPAEEIRSAAGAQHDQPVLALLVAEAVAAAGIGDPGARDRREPVRLGRRRRQSRLGLRLHALEVLAEDRRHVGVVDVADRPGIDAEQRAVGGVEAHEDRARRRGDEHEPGREPARRDHRVACALAVSCVGLRDRDCRRDGRRVVVGRKLWQQAQHPLRRAWDRAAASLVAPWPQRQAQPAPFSSACSENFPAAGDRGRRGLRRRAAGQDQQPENHSQRHRDPT